MSRVVTWVTRLLGQGWRPFSSNVDYPCAVGGSGWREFAGPFSSGRVLVALPVPCRAASPAVIEI